MADTLLAASPSGTVSVEPPDGWAAKQLALTRLRNLGYTVTELRYFDVPGGRSVLVITG